MYTCVNAILRPRDQNARLSETQVGSSVVRDLVNVNNIAVLILTNPAVTHPLSLDLFDPAVQSIIYTISPTLTVNDWLTGLADASLPTKDTIPTLTTGKIKYNDLAGAGYTFQKIHPLAGDGSQMPEAELTDILVTKTDVDYQQLYESCLFSVNGLLHITDYSSAGLKIKGAGHSVMYSNRNQLGVMSLRDIGVMSYLPITADMLKPITDGGDLADGFTLALPDTDLTGKVVMLSVAGVLTFADEGYQVTGAHSIYVSWSHIPLAHRFFEADTLIDMATFKATMTRNVNHGDALDLVQAQTDAAITAYMTMSQSFIILIDTDHLYYERHALEMTQLPGRYYAYERPDFPLQLENGLLPPYMAFQEDSTYVVACDKNLIKRYVHDTRPATVDAYFNSAAISQFPQYYSAGYLLEIGRDYLS